MELSAAMFICGENPKADRCDMSNGNRTEIGGHLRVMLTVSRQMYGFRVARKQEGKNIIE
jgi:hypothetical protein